MPVFFFVGGGFSNGLSWNSARKDPEKARGWAATRLSRLLKPTLPLVALWAVAAAIAARMGVDVELIAVASQSALVPIWFLAVYIVITVAVPLSMAAWNRIGFASVVILWGGGGAIVVDTIAFGLDLQWLRWANYGFVWLGVHQLGYWWGGGGAQRQNVWALGFIALGAVWLYVLIGLLDFPPVGMVSVPGEEFSNTRPPPTTAMLALGGAVQIGLILLVSGTVKRWLARPPGPWSWVIVMNQMIMSIYLWHITAMVAVIGLAMLAGGIGLELQPGGAGGWWAMRPIWLVAFCLVLAPPFVMIFLPFEAGSRTPLERRPGGPLASALGTLVTCAGLIMIAMNGIGAGNALGVNWIAVGGLVLAGVYLATRRIGG